MEEGFKTVRGQLTEGRYLTFEQLGFALTNYNGKFVSISLASKKHDSAKQRWIIHTVGGVGAGNEFYIQSAVDKQYIAKFPQIGQLTKDQKNAQAFKITYNPDGATYSISATGNSYVKVNPGSGSRRRAAAAISWDGGFGGFKIYSVSYHS